MSALDDLVRDLNNQSCWTVTGPDEGQCTAVPHEWEERLGLPIVYGNAIDTYDNAPDSLYEKELNTPTGVPRPGSIIVFGEYAPYNISAQYGHTAVALDGCTPDTLVVLEQNWGEQVVRVHSRDYGGVKGWFYPRVLEAVPPAPDPIPQPTPLPNPPQQDPPAAPPPPDPMPEPPATPISPPKPVPAPGGALPAPMPHPEPIPTQTWTKQPPVVTPPTLLTRILAILSNLWSELFK